MEGKIMTLTKDHIGGLLFLALSVVYGYYAYEIRMFPGDQFEPFNAQTIPRALAWVGSIVAILMLATGSRSATERLSFAGLDVKLVAKLMLLVWIFAQALSWLGFLLSTIGFLLVGYWLLGERRPRTLLLASVPFAVGFWFLLAKLLDIYLAPGQVWQWL
jgi:putative tricarboxylic transport membrane protein